MSTSKLSTTLLRSLCRNSSKVILTFKLEQNKLKLILLIKFLS